MAEPTNQFHLRPDFLIIGAAKAGTTTLHDRLSRHPALFLTENKEPSFFSYRPDRWIYRAFKKMVQDYKDQGGFIDEAAAAADSPQNAWRHYLPAYRALFQNARPDQLRGEASTNYTRIPQYPDVPQRIAEIAPDAKFIYLMRHPVDRAFSHYVHRWSNELHRGEPFRESFEQFIQHEPVCVDSSRYMTQIEAFLQLFPRDRFLFLKLEDLQADPLNLTRRVLNFLGVADSPENLEAQHAEIRRNEAAQNREVAVRKAMTARFRNIPPLHAAWRALPSGVRDRLIQGIRHSRFGQRLQSEFTPPKMLPETRQALYRELADETQRLAAFLDWDLSSWLADPQPHAP